MREPKLSRSDPQLDWQPGALGWSRLGCVWRVGPTKSMSSKTSIQPEALSQQLRSHEVTMPIAAITGAFRAINDLSLLMARIAMPNGNGLVWRKKATFFT